MKFFFFLHKASEKELVCCVLSYVCASEDLSGESKQLPILPTLVVIVLLLLLLYLLLLVLLVFKRDFLRRKQTLLPSAFS